MTKIVTLSKCHCNQCHCKRGNLSRLRPGIMITQSGWLPLSTGKHARLLHSCVPKLTRGLITRFCDHRSKCARAKRPIRGDTHLTFELRGVEKIPILWMNSTNRLREMRMKGGGGGLKSRKFCGRHICMAP